MKNPVQKQSDPLLPDDHWKVLRRLTSQSFQSSLHFAFATVNPDGSPHITPIGSFLLHHDQPTGFYFELFTARLQYNIEGERRVCILAVNSHKWFWLRALFSGRFSAPPAVRLLGTVGERRLATEEEHALFQKRIRRVRLLKGSQILWGNMRYVREIHFDTVEPVLLGPMTRGLWEATHE